MTSLIVLVPVALILVSVAIGIYLWAIRSDQYVDLDREASRILFDDSRKDDGQ